MDASFDIVIVGAGMAGASLAAEIGDRAKVLVLEAEDRPGYHATGRSAAFWTESYGGPGVQPLTTASSPVLRDLGVLTPRGALTLGRADQQDEVSAFAARFAQAGVDMRVLGRAEIERLVPALQPQWTCAAFEPSTCDIDVAALHQHYLAAARHAGCELRCRTGLTGVQRMANGWVVTTADGGKVRAPMLVNAAGAWADQVATMAHVHPIGIRPYRRTIAQVAVAAEVPDDLPLVLDIGGTFYFKPESRRLWVSPHDETASDACDAAPEELDVALAIDRFEQVCAWHVERVEHRWAGLRSFAPDRLPVYGFAPQDPAFFWFAGQGGFGIQTAPAAAQLAARLLLGDAPGAVDPAPYSPARAFMPA